MDQGKRGYNRLKVSRKRTSATGYRHSFIKRWRELQSRKESIRWPFSLFGIDFGLYVRPSYNPFGLHEEDLNLLMFSL